MGSIGSIGVYHEQSLKIDYNQITTPPPTQNNEMMHQLYTFGYNDNDIKEAMLYVSNPNDINEIIQYITTNDMKMMVKKASLSDEIPLPQSPNINGMKINQIKKEL